jgi:hypothetical protein
LFIDGGLREYAAQLGLTGVGGLAVLFAGTAFDFLLGAALLDFRLSREFTTG